MGSGPVRSYLRFGLSSVVVVELAEPPATMKAVPKSTPVGFVFSFFSFGTWGDSLTHLAHGSSRGSAVRESQRP